LHNTTPPTAHKQTLQLVQPQKLGFMALIGRKLQQLQEVPILLLIQAIQQLLGQQQQVIL
jgi:hypothetical protein